MKETANIIIAELYSLGLSPHINLSKDREDIRIGIDVDVCGVHLSFNFNHNASTVNYALLFPTDRKITFETRMEIYRILRTDSSDYYDLFLDDYCSDHLALIGNRKAEVITPLFIQCMIEEISSLRVVEKLKHM